VTRSHVRDIVHLVTLHPASEATKNEYEDRLVSRALCLRGLHNAESQTRPRKHDHVDLLRGSCNVVVHICQGSLGENAVPESVNLTLVLGMRLFLPNEGSADGHWAHVLRLKIGSAV
jgi:hypothetical protein